MSNKNYIDFFFHSLFTQFFKNCPVDAYHNSVEIENFYNNNNLSDKYTKIMFNRPSHIECPTSVSLLLAITLSLCVLHTQCGSGVLNNFPIKFEMLGTTTYIPDSGGVSRNGYKLRIGFQNYQWLAVEIITNTDKNDVLVMQIN